MRWLKTLDNFIPVCASVPRFRRTTAPNFFRIQNHNSSRRSSTITENHPRIEYNWIRGVERFEGYTPGGHGGFSTVWLVQDTQEKRYVALKVNIADSIPQDVQMLNFLSAPSDHPGRNAIPTCLDEFEVTGLNGTHICCTAPLAACHLRDVSFSGLFPLDVARVLSYKLTQAVVYVHSKGIVHGDIHLNNILAKLPLNLDHLSIEELYEQYGKPETVCVSRRDGEPLPPNVPAKAILPLFLGKYAENFTLSDTCLLLNDYGEAFPSTKIRLGEDCHTPSAFRAPETHHDPKAPFSYPLDIWGLATAIWEIMGMKALFAAEFMPEEYILAQHVDVLGPLPSQWWEAWEGRKQFFDEDGTPTEHYYPDQWPTLDQAFEDRIREDRTQTGHEITDEEKVDFVDMIHRMLAFRPEDRPTAEDVLGSEWMRKWALPDYKRSLEVL
ncbi:kinase-like domain-containing protein [Aspergillus granulosus]|uniref:Kinase-like domain-containing protein n=1 Tax=Aspergillus granulosus TaxID=176169 RepID=A0ABR4I0J1_9EURO